MLSRKGLILGTLIAGGVLSASVKADTVTFFQFSADHDVTSSGFKEFQYSPTAGLGFRTGPGSVGNGNTNSPGLNGTVTGDLSPVIHFGYGVPDMTLSFGVGSFQAVSAATSFTAGGYSQINQPLTGGSFTLTAIDPVTSLPVVYLSGLVDSATLIESKSTIGPITTRNASVQSGTVTYTGGALYTQFASHGLIEPGIFSFSLSGLTGSFGQTSPGGKLLAFDADGSGTFDATVVPTPAAVYSGMGLLGLLAANRVKKSRRDAKA